jgi:hypothetical protein
MIVFDIETTGLDRNAHQITVICVYDCENNTDHCFNFARDGLSRSEEFIKILDDTDVICCFNGVKFDLPFVISFFKVPPERYNHYFMKVFDYYEYCRLLFDASCSLNNLLKANGHVVKTSSGLQAVIMAKEKKWAELEEYCKQDTRKTGELCLMPILVIPLRNKPHVICTHSWVESPKHNMSFVQTR